MLAWQLFPRLFGVAAAREIILNCTLSKWLITCHRSLPDFYWSINNVWHVGGSAMVGGLLLIGSWFSSRRFFCSSPRPPPLARFVNPQPGTELAARIQDGDLITNSGFFDHPNRLRAGYKFYRCNATTVITSRTMVRLVDYKNKSFIELTCG